MFKIVVDPDRCTGDGLCVEVCPVDVFELQEGKAVPLKGDECLGCESCVGICESDAITLTEV